MKTLLSFGLTVLIIPVFAQIDAKTQQNNIQGTWYSTSLDDKITLKLDADGSGEFEGEAIRYTAKDKKFTMTIVGETETIVYNYTLQGNSLTISGGDLEAPVTFSRNGTTDLGGK